MTKKENKSEKDIWDKLDVLGKITASIVLIAISIIIKFSADKVATSIKRGELIKSLITDLTTKDTLKTRQDLALVALNRTIGDQDPKLVIEIAEMIIKNENNYNNLAGNQAFKILKERDSLKAAEIERLAQQVSKEIHDKLIAFNISPDTLPKEIVDEDKNILERIYSDIIYIQFKNEENRQLMKSLQIYLKNQSYNAPGVERVDHKFMNVVKFFNPNDRMLARKVVAHTKLFFEQNDISFDLELQNLSTNNYNAPKGQIEIWLNLKFISQIIDLTSKNTKTRRDARLQLINEYSDDKELLVKTLLSSVLPVENKNSYRRNLGIVYVLANLNSKWEGTDEQFLKIQNLRNISIHYNDKTFDENLEKAISNYQNSNVKIE